MALPVLTLRVTWIFGWGMDDTFPPIGYEWLRDDDSSLILDDDGQIIAAPYYYFY